ncbi:MAG: NeuD/PglB/VioB family sugar acetyltransferase [Pseudomonadota bacterium]
MEEIILVGGGGHCKSVIDVIEQQAKYHIAGIIDKKEFLGTEVLGYKVIGCDEDLPSLQKQYTYAIITVGQIKSNAVRVNLFETLKKLGFNMPVIISPLAYVSRHASVDEGTVVLHGAIVNSQARIGKNCIINTKSLIEHDAVVEDNCHISTGAIINGGVIVKANTFFGSNTTSKEYITIDGFIKAGSVAK